jgi:hypothetical protein
MSRQSGSVVGFKVDEGSIQQFPAGHEDDVQTGRELVPTKHLTRQPLRTIAQDSGSEFAAGGDAKPSAALVVRDEEQGHEPAPDTGPRVVRALEFRSATDPLAGSEALPGGHLSARQPP